MYLPSVLLFHQISPQWEDIWQYSLSIFNEFCNLAIHYMANTHFAIFYSILLQQGYIYRPKFYYFQQFCKMRG